MILFTSQRILTESEEIKEALKYLYEYLKVNLQTKLAGYKDFVHYNEIKEDQLPLKALFFKRGRCFGVTMHFIIWKKSCVLALKTGF
ncbi:hypothetical protein ID0445_08390 [Helicobacter pylori]